MDQKCVESCQGKKKSLFIILKTFMSLLSFAAGRINNICVDCFFMLGLKYMILLNLQFDRDRLKNWLIISGCTFSSMAKNSVFSQIRSVAGTNWTG